MRYLNLAFIFLTFSFFSNYVYCSKIYDLFNQKITIDKVDLKAKEFFDYLSEKTGIKFKVYLLEELEKKDVRLTASDLKNISLSKLLRILEENMKLKYELKFSDEEVYILVNFEKSRPFIGKSNPEDKITIDLKKAKLKDLMETLGFYTGKEIIFLDEQLSNLELTVNEKSIEWQDLLNKLSKEYRFEYKIGDRNILISKSPTLKEKIFIK